MKKGNFITSRLKSFKNAFSGIGYVIKNEVNARIHLLAAFVAILLGYFLKISSAEWLWISLSIALVFILEIINTAIERLCDMVEPEYNKNIKHIKDLAAAAVVVGAAFSVVVALVVFLPKVLC